MTVNADDYFGTATAPAADAPRKRSTNPDDYFGKVPEPVAPQKGTIERVREAVGNASDPAQRPAGERRGGTRSEAPAPYGAGDKRVEPPTGNVLDKAPAEQPPGQPLIEQRGAPISDEAASAIKRSVGAMPTSEAPRPFSDEALKSATELLAGMSPEQRANQLARTDLPKWMRSAMQAAARNLDKVQYPSDNAESDGTTLTRRGTYGEPLLRPEFVESVRQGYATAKPEQRLSMLKEDAKRSDLIGRAARVILADVQRENAQAQDAIWQHPAMSAAAAAAPSKGDGDGRVMFPDVRPTLRELADNPAMGLDDQDPQRMRESAKMHAGGQAVASANLGLAGIRDRAKEETTPLSFEQTWKDLKGGVAQALGLGVGAGAFGASVDFKAANDSLADLDAVDQGQQPTRTAAAQLTPDGKPRLGAPNPVVVAYMAAPPEQRLKIRESLSGALMRDQAFIQKSAQAIKGFEEYQKQQSGQLPDFTDIRTATDFVRWAIRTGVSTSPTMAASMIGALAGPAGLAFTSGVMATGDMTTARAKFATDNFDPTRYRNPDRQTAAAEQQAGLTARHLAKNAGTTALLSIPYAALDFLGPAGTLAMGNAKDLASKGWKAILKKGAQEIGEEMFNEGGQEVVNIASDMAAGERSTDVTVADGKRVINAAAAGGLMGAGGHAVNVGADAMLNRPEQQIARAINGNAGLWEKYFVGRSVIPDAGGVIKPQPPTKLRDESLKRFDELAAAFGLNPEAAKRVRKQAEGKAAADIPGFLGRVTEALNKRGLFARPVTDAGVRHLDLAINGDPPEQGDPTMDAPPSSAVPAPSVPVAPRPVPSVPGTNASLDAGALLGTPVDEEAHTAATSPTNPLPEPTDGQKEAGNYKKGHIKLGGLDISIENPQGSVRRGTDEDGKAWENTLQHHYGYIRGTLGADGDHVDTFIKPGTPEDYSGPVFVVDQRNPKTGKFDEHKVLLGFDNPQEAEAAYRSNYAPGWDGLGHLTGLDMPAFKDWVRNGNHKAPFSAGFKEGRNVDQPGVAAPAPVAAPAVDGGSAVAGGSVGNLGSPPAADGGVGGAAAAPVPGGAAPAPVGGAGSTGPALSDTPDFTSTWPRPVPNADGKGSAFEGLEDDPEFMAKAVAGVHQEVGFGVQSNVATAKVLRSAIEKGIDPATGEQATPERLTELQGELQGALDGIDSLLGDYEGEFGPAHREAFQRTLVPDLADLHSPVEAPAPETAAPAQESAAATTEGESHVEGQGQGQGQEGLLKPTGADATPHRGGLAAPAPAPLTDAQKKRQDALKRIGKVMNAPEIEAVAPVQADSGSAAPAPAATAPGNTVVEQDGKFFVRLGDDRALVGPIKTRAEAESYAASAGKGAPVPAAGWESGPFADRLNKALADMEALGPQGIEMARIVRTGLADAVRAGKLDEARVAHAEDTARKTAGRLNRQPTTWEPMTLEQLQAEDSTVGTLPEAIQQAALAKMNELGPQLAAQGAKSWREVDASWPKEATDTKAKMLEVLQALMHLAPARYAEAKDHKNRNPDKLGRMEDFATQVLGIDTRAHPGVATDNQITVGAGVRTTKAKAKAVQLYPKTVAGSELLGWVNRAGGISYELLHELSFKRETGKLDRHGKPVYAWLNPSGGPNVGAKGRPGGHGLFREGGLGMDYLTQAFEESGLIRPGSIADDYKAADEAVQEMITAALNKAEPEAFTDVEANAEKEKDAAWYAHMEAQKADEAEEIRLFLLGEVGLSESPVEEQDDSFWAADNPAWDQPSESLTIEDLLWSLGLSDTEIGEYLQLQERLNDAHEEIARSDGYGEEDRAGREADGNVTGEARAAGPPGADAARPAGGQGLGQVVSAVASLDDRLAIEVARALGVELGSSTPADARTSILMRDDVAILAAIDQARGTPAFGLEAQTPEDLKAKAEREAAAVEAERRRKTAEQERLRKEAEDRDNRARADQTVDDFQLGQMGTASVTLTDAAGGKRVVATNSKTFQRIKQEPNEAARPNPQAAAGEGAAPPAPIDATMAAPVEPAVEPPRERNAMGLPMGTRPGPAEKATAGDLKADDWISQDGQFIRVRNATQGADGAVTLDLDGMMSRQTVTVPAGQTVSRHKIISAKPAAAPAAPAAPAPAPTPAAPVLQTLEAQTAEDLKAKAEREAAALEADRRKRAVEQERLRKEAEGRDIKARADATVDDFQLGQSADQQLSGMTDLFADPPAPPVSHLPTGRDKNAIALRKRVAVLKALRECLG